MKKMQLILLLTALVGAVGCSSPCRNSLVREVVSPDLQKKAVLFYRNSGALDDYTTEPSILGRNDALPLSEIGNTARMGHDSLQPRPPSRREYIDLGMEWRSPKELVVSTPTAVEIETLLKESANVLVTYTTVTSRE